MEGINHDTDRHRIKGAFDDEKMAEASSRLTATAMASREQGETTGLAIYSYDRQMNLCAKALGFAVHLL